MMEEVERNAEGRVTTVYFDGSCPLCRSEIAYYRRSDTASRLRFIDVSQATAPPPPGISPDMAMRRFHVQAADGRVLSGAAAFVAVWSTLLGWRWAARFAALPGATPLLESAYRAFLPVRPHLSRALRRLSRVRSVNRREVPR